MMKKLKRHDLKSSVLFLEIEQKNTKAAIEALGSGESVDIRDLDGNTPLVRAAFLGLTDLVSHLLQHGATPNAVNDRGWSALHFAAQEGHTALARLLIEAGAEVDLRDQDGNTPLSNAVFSRSTDVVRVLINVGADPNASNDHGISPQELADSMGFQI